MPATRLPEIYFALLVLVLRRLLFWLAREAIARLTRLVRRREVDTVFFVGQMIHIIRFVEDHCVNVANIRCLACCSAPASGE